jgi:hypothetical protein
VLTHQHLTAYSLRFAALCSGFRQQVSLGVRRNCEEPVRYKAVLLDFYR